ncbi:leucine-rich repeat flightless-interacting protein 1-like [Silurus meridionalis]|uniref:Uncharacterized protein n=1 Tax=Silurus meridionalis TaxID=175797 RepID=A0A8T0BKV4_SILME|nr:leucine-rich repeat flightless-interacting protein 1-like isoform X1 [Silurus meridionalis]XP_046703658.1 leucine-rich repeat flightless-interacting protein 1-like [Silurus meridionalis]XP_046703659.1 leucine-rich repeat flightless-interacting protein 1-like [Silurus meridionalis]KAF7707901.1 hypothetical protein HF521_016958 [Silurus meridionalis]
MESSVQLQKEIYKLVSDMDLLQSSAQQKEEELLQTNRACRMMMAEEKYELLMSQVDTMQDSVQHLEKELREKSRKCEEKTKETGQEQEGHSFLQSTKR